MVLSMAGFAAEDAIIKALSGRVPVGQVTFLIGFMGAVFFTTLATRRGARVFTRQALRGLLLARNLSEMVATTAMILGIALAPLSVVAAVFQAMPLVVTMGAALFLGEPVGWRRWTAIVVGFVGVLMIVRPGLQGFDPLALLPLIAVFMLTVRDLATRRIQEGVSSVQLSAWGFMVVMPAGLILLALRGEVPLVPSATDGGLIVLCTVFGILSYAALVQATRTGAIAVTTPFRYSRLVFAMLLGVIFFGERPDAMTLAGAALIVTAGLYSMLREIALKRRVLR